MTVLCLPPRSYCANTPNTPLLVATSSVPLRLFTPINSCCAATVAHPRSMKGLALACTPHAYGRECNDAHASPNWSRCRFGALRDDFGGCLVGVLGKVGLE